jgi:plastocyanin
MMVNGCDPATAEDHTGQANVSIDFGGALGFKYAPACIKVSPGTSVTFNGSFVSHPLAGGQGGVLDASSPITLTATGTTASFTLANAGTYPYYCQAHFSLGMQGAIFVQ